MLGAFQALSQAKKVREPSTGQMSALLLSGVVERNLRKYITIIINAQVVDRHLGPDGVDFHEVAIGLHGKNLDFIACRVCDIVKPIMALDDPIRKVSIWVGDFA